MQMPVAVMEKIIVEVMDTPEEVRASGIILPTAIMKPPQVFGKVLSVGEDVGFDVKPGDTVMFSNHAGQVIIIQEKMYRVLMDKEVYGKLVEDTIDDECPKDSEE